MSRFPHISACGQIGLKGEFFVFRTCALCCLLMGCWCEALASVFPVQRRAPRKVSGATFWPVALPPKPLHIITGRPFMRAPEAGGRGVRTHSQASLSHRWNARWAGYRFKLGRLTAQWNLSAVFCGRAAWVGVLHRDQGAYDAGGKGAAPRLSTRTKSKSLQISFS